MNNFVENNFFIQLKSGNEEGFNYFYHRFYRLYLNRALRYIREEDEAHGAVQEAFSRVWIFREALEDSAHLHRFLNRCLKAACATWRGSSRNRFRRNLVPFPDYEEGLLSYNAAVFDSVADTGERSGPDPRQLHSLHRLLPHLDSRQQLFIRLCLRFDFNFERIALYLGGVSEQEVERQVGKCIERLKSLLDNSRKLLHVKPVITLHTDPRLSTTQAEVLRLRYEQGCSFEEIAHTLRLTPAYTRTLFIQAFTLIKNNHGKNHPHTKNPAAYQLQR